MIEQIFSNTPWWVYLILIYVISIGIKSIKGGPLPLIKLFIIPIIFVWLSIDMLMSSIGITAPYIGIWLIGIVLGSILGWWQFKRLKIEVDKKKRMLNIEGSWFTLIFLLLTFIVKYYIGYTLGTYANVSDEFITVSLIASGFFTGAFIGRLLYGLYKFKIGPFIEL